MKALLSKAARALGYKIIRCRSKRHDSKYPPDISPDDQAILRRVTPYTMTSLERQVALIQAARYIIRRRIPGSFVECGVWRDGSTMAAALTFLQEGEANRHLYLYDTFEGMQPPTDEDMTSDGTSAQKLIERENQTSGSWCRASIDDVMANMKSTKYPDDFIYYIKGMVEETIPSQLLRIPIALLRLYMDWYESTTHVMNHLFPLLIDGGILIIDDYGHWQGARKAIDEYFSENSKIYFLNRIDYTGRLLIKP